MGYGNLGLHSLIIKTDGSLWTAEILTDNLETGAARIEELQLRFYLLGRSSIFRAIPFAYYQDRWSHGLLGEMLKANLVMEPLVQRNIQLRFCLRVFLGIAGYYHSVILKTDGSGLVGIPMANLRWDHYESKYTNSNNIFGVVQVSAGTLHFNT